jgi:hypothetical protein
MDRSAVRALLSIVPLLAGVLVLAGCGLGAGPAPTAVQLLVSRDFGGNVLGRTSKPHVAGAETIMSLLMRNYDVGTRYSGGFVQSIDGVAGGSERGHSVDWFYYVNGVEATRGAAEVTVHPGDHIWWDRHNWSQTESVPAVVGSFPEPFLNGIEGRRLPVRIECEAAAGTPCRTVLARLRDAGVSAAVAAPASSAGPGTLRILVGRWANVRADPVARLIDEGPRASGVYARFTGGGQRLELLDEDGATAQSLAAGAGLLAATRQGEGLPTWVVTGTDDTGMGRAADALTATALADRFAVAVTAAGSIPVPEPAAAGG